MSRDTRESEEEFRVVHFAAERQSFVIDAAVAPDEFAAEGDHIVLVVRNELVEQAAWFDERVVLVVGKSVVPRSNVDVLSNLDRDDTLAVTVRVEGGDFAAPVLDFAVPDDRA